jgi:hypothetical protein
VALGLAADQARTARSSLLLILAVAIIWIWRKSIADDYIRDELASRGVQATYTLDRVGFGPSRSAISSSAIRPTPT